MKSKEEILISHYSYMGKAAPSSHKQIYEAMGEYAKEVAIDFKNWCDENSGNIDYADETYHSNKEYFEIYINSKKQ